MTPFRDTGMACCKDEPNLEVQSRWNNFKGITTQLQPEWHLQDTVGLGRDRAKWGE